MCVPHPGEGFYAVGVSSLSSSTQMQRCQEMVEGQDGCCLVTESLPGGELSPLHPRSICTHALHEPEIRGHGVDPLIPQGLFVTAAGAALHIVGDPTESHM